MLAPYSVSRASYLEGHCTTRLSATKTPSRERAFHNRTLCQSEGIGHMALVDNWWCPVALNQAEAQGAAPRLPVDALSVYQSGDAHPPAIFGWSPRYQFLDGKVVDS